MKKLISITLLFLLASCAVKEYYQVYKTSIDGTGALKDNRVTFEDSNCVVTYNLWTNGGYVGFNIYNKSSNDLTIDLAKTFFVLNGYAYEYFQNRTFSKSSNYGTTVTTYNNPYYNNSNLVKFDGSTSSSFSTTFFEKSELTIPSKTHLNISEYSIVNSVYETCNWDKYPSQKKIKPLTFSKSNSPFVFYNLISYRLNAVNFRLENKFYVSEIVNVPSDKMFIWVDTANCGEPVFPSIRLFQNQTPDKFYFKYTKGK